jgi:hypothetical protein
MAVSLDTLTCGIYGSIRTTISKDVIMALFIKKTGLIVGIGLLSFSFCSVAYGAGCQIKYGWNKGNTLAGTFENKSKTINLSKGQTKTINKKRMNYVKNLKNRKVKFYLKKATDVTLGKGQRNPAVGTYVQKVKLKKVKCKDDDSSSSSSSSGSTSSGVSLECSPIDVAKTPVAPMPGGMPIPYPNMMGKKKCKP